MHGRHGSEKDEDPRGDPHPADHPSEGHEEEVDEGLPIALLREAELSGRLSVGGGDTGAVCEEVSLNRGLRGDELHDFARSEGASRVTRGVKDIPRRITHRKHGHLCAATLRHARIIQ